MLDHCILIMLMITNYTNCCVIVRTFQKRKVVEQEKDVNSETFFCCLDLRIVQTADSGLWFFKTLRTHCIFINIVKHKKFLLSYLIISYPKSCGQSHSRLNFRVILRNKNERNAFSRAVQCEKQRKNLIY